MTSLTNIKDEYLNDKIFKVLSHNKINTIVEFLRQDSEKLMAITKLSLPQILSIRSNIFERYSAPVLNAKDVYKNSKRKYIDTGIESLNRISGGGIPLGYITELCGLADTGKTQLCLQLAINCAKKDDNNVLFIDTKGDFSSVRIQKILDSSGHSHKDMAVIMNRIKIIRIWNMEELVNLFDQLKQDIVAIDDLTLIVIDSLPCLMFQHLSDDTKVGLSFLNLFVNNCKFLCKESNISIICVNIFTRWVDQDVSDIDEADVERCGIGEPRWVEKKIRCLGKYWQHIPALVLASEKYKEKNNDQDNFLKVSVTKSVYGKCNESCILKVNSFGIT